MLNQEVMLYTLANASSFLSKEATMLFSAKEAESQNIQKYKLSMVNHPAQAFKVPNLRVYYQNHQYGLKSDNRRIVSCRYNQVVKNQADLLLIRKDGTYLLYENNDTLIVPCGKILDRFLNTVTLVITQTESFYVDTRGNRIFFEEVDSIPKIIRFFSQVQEELSYSLTDSTIFPVKQKTLLKEL